MIKELSSLERFRAAWETQTDCSVQSIPAVDLFQLGIGGDDAFYADQKLRQAGAFEMLMGKLEPEQRRTWEHSRNGAVILGACLVASPSDCFPPEQVAIAAVRHTSAQAMGEVGMLWIVGKRVRGSSKDVIALGEKTSDLAYTASAVISSRYWRAQDAAYTRRIQEKLRRG